MNLAILTKRQRDAALRQQTQDPAKATIIVSEDTAGSGSVTNPATPTWESLAGKPALYPPIPHSLLSHADVPVSYAGQSGKTLLVKTTEDGFEFGNAGGGGSAAWDYGLITSPAGSEFDQDWGGLI